MNPHLFHTTETPAHSVKHLTLQPSRVGHVYDCLDSLHDKSLA